MSLLYEIPIRAIQLSDLAAMRGILDDTLIPPSVLGTFFVGLGDDRDTAVASWPQESSILFYRHPLTGAVPTSAPEPRATARHGALSDSGFVTDSGLGARIAARTAEVAASSSSVGCGQFEHEGERYLLLTRLMYADAMRSRVDRYVGFAVPVAEIVRRYMPSLAAEIRGSDRDFSTQQPLEISVIDERGNEVFQTGPSLLTQYVHEASFPLMLIGDNHLSANPDDHFPLLTWKVRSGYPGTSAAALARGSTNRQRQLLILVSVLAAIGILLSGRAIAREHSLADLRAEFVSSVSHDLKTPLASIQLLADVLRTRAMMPEGKVRGYDKVIGTEARKLGNLIDGILEFDRIDAGGRVYSVEEIDLRNPLREALGESAAQLKETDFRTELRLPDRRVPFVGDREALVHAFSNLIGNAIKYSQDRRFLRVVMRLDHGNAVIDVEDEGIGIPAAERSNIFEHFYRVRTDPGTNPAGTGLGLPIARHVVHAHGGRISMVGKRDGGSVFTVELPLVYAGAESEWSA